MVGLPVQIVRQAYFCGTNSKSKFELLTFYSSDAILSTEIFEPKEAISCPVSMMNTLKVALNYMERGIGLSNQRLLKNF